MTSSASVADLGPRRVRPRGAGTEGWHHAQASRTAPFVVDDPLRRAGEAKPRRRNARQARRARREVGGRVQLDGRPVGVRQDYCAL